MTRMRGSRPLCGQSCEWHRRINPCPAPIGPPRRKRGNAMTLTKVEQETIVLFNEAEATASVYTHNAALQRILLELCQSHPAQASRTEDNRHGGLTFEIPKKWVKIAPPRALSEAQKKVLEDMNRRNQERRK